MSALEAFTPCEYKIRLFRNRFEGIIKTIKATKPMSIIR
jgi:hypothetical protein